MLWGNRVVVPIVGRALAMDVLHEGHLGICHMKSLARGVVWWLGIDEDLQRKVRECSKCQLHQKSPAAAPLHPWEWPERPWARLHIDYASPFQGRMFLVVVDSYSKWLEVMTVASANSHNTIETANHVCDEWTAGGDRI